MKISDNGSRKPSWDDDDAMSGPDVADYEPPPYLLPPSLPELALRLWRQVTRTPTRASLAMVAALSVVIGGAALAPVTVRAADARGPYRARCGIGYYIAGHPSLAIARQCHAAYGGHALVFCLAATTFAVSVAALVLLTAERRVGPWLQRLWSTPARAALVTFDLVMGLVALVALRTVSVATVDARGPLVAHCGVAYYVVGSGDPQVQKACRAAYGGHAAVVLLAGGLCMCGTLLLRRLTRTSGEVRGHSADRGSPADPVPTS